MTPSIFYTTFDKRSDALRALRRARMIPVDDSDFRVRVHRGDVQLYDLTIAESDFPRAALRGGAIGGIAGLILGIIISAPGTFTAAPVIATLLFCALAGAIFGTLGSGLYGLGLPDPALAALGENLDEGQLLITVETHSEKARVRLERIFKRFGEISYPQAA